MLAKNGIKHVHDTSMPALGWHMLRQAPMPGWPAGAPAAMVIPFGAGSGEGEEPGGGEEEPAARVVGPGGGFYLFEGPGYVCMCQELAGRGG